MPSLSSFLVAALFASFPLVSAKPSDAILLSRVQSLTFHAGRRTTARRVPAIPQLRCISSPALCALHSINRMRCTNRGAAYDAEDIQWTCVADLPDILRIGSTDVICEGYSSLDDSYILRGSCGVEYTLILTEQGERLHPEILRQRYTPSRTEDWVSTFFTLFFVAALVWILYKACINPNPPRASRRFGGGGDGGWGPGWDSRFVPDSKSAFNTDNAWRPGFWSGLASGAVAGYWAGAQTRRNNRSSRTRPRDLAYGFDGDDPNPWGESSSTRPSTGFGSTSRR